MKIERRQDGARERKILTAMIVDKLVLARIASKWDKSDKEGLFKTKWANIVASWCIKYFNRYEDAPNSAIEGMFEAWSERTKDKDTIKLVEKFLNAISDEYETLAEEINPDYVIDQASEHFNKVRAIRFKTALEGYLDTGEVDEAVKKIETGFQKVELGAGGYVDILHDKDAIRHAFESKSEPLIQYPGALGEFYGDSLERDAFVAFMAPEKRGKSFLLLDMAWIGMKQGRRVAFFEVGDLSQDQAIRRFMTRAAHCPVKKRNRRFPFDVNIPVEIFRDPDSAFAQVNHKTKAFEKPLTWKMGVKACEKVMKKIDSKESRLRMSCHPNDSITVGGIRSVLKGWEREGWVPDVVVIDYADILAPPSGVAETRDQINKTWKQLRAMSQSLHCLVVTATQSDAASYKADILSRQHFSEDKRKYAHVTALFGINQTIEEKQRQVMRLNTLVLREEGFIETNCVHIAGCLELANPAVKSCF